MVSARSRRVGSQLFPWCLAENCQDGMWAGLRLFMQSVLHPRDYLEGARTCQWKFRRKGSAYARRLLPYRPVHRD